VPAVPATLRWLTLSRLTSSRLRRRLSEPPVRGAVGAAPEAGRCAASAARGRRVLLRADRLARPDFPVARQQDRTQPAARRGRLGRGRRGGRGRSAVIELAEAAATQTSSWRGRGLARLQHDSRQAETGASTILSCQPLGIRCRRAALAAGVRRPHAGATGPAQRRDRPGQRHRRRHPARHRGGRRGATTLSTSSTAPTLWSTSRR
jgi:hypothetical protein